MTTEDPLDQFDQAVADLRREYVRQVLKVEAIRDDIRWGRLTPDRDESGLQAASAELAEQQSWLEDFIGQAQIQLDRWSLLRSDTQRGTIFDITGNPHTVTRVEVGDRLVDEDMASGRE